MSRGRRASLAALLLAAAVAGVIPTLPATVRADPGPGTAPAPAAAPDGLASTVGFGEATADARLGAPAAFRQPFTAPAAPVRAELRLTVGSDPWTSVFPATVEPSGDGWVATATRGGHAMPNATWRWRIDLAFADGSVARGPLVSTVVVDDRFAWRTRTRDGIVLHWYEGDDAFADRALAVGADAVDRAAALLGARPDGPVHLLVYADRDDFYDALGPGTRENVGGQANRETATMYALITPDEVGSDWVTTVVAHELTHLVFDAVARNPWAEPPRWLNEGVAVWLTQGLTDEDRRQVARAVADRSLIPLEGLAGYFPAVPAAFSLAYAESASAIAYLVDRWGEPALGTLIRAYADGGGDDAAFTAALGIDRAAFEAAWLASLGAPAPSPYGPRPGPAGPVPPGWTSGG